MTAGPQDLPVDPAAPCRPSHAPVGRCRTPASEASRADAARCTLQYDPVADLQPGPETATIELDPKRGVPAPGARGEHLD